MVSDMLGNAILCWALREKLVDYTSILLEGFMIQGKRQEIYSIEKQTSVQYRQGL